MCICAWECVCEFAHVMYEGVCVCVHARVAHEAPPVGVPDCWGPYNRPLSPLQDVPTCGSLANTLGVIAWLVAPTGLRAERRKRS